MAEGVDAVARGRPHAACVVVVFLAGVSSLKNRVRSVRDRGWGGEHQGTYIVFERRRERERKKRESGVDLLLRYKQRKSGVLFHSGGLLLHRGAPARIGSIPRPGSVAVGVRVARLAGWFCIHRLPPPLHPLSRRRRE